MLSGFIIMYCIIALAEDFIHRTELSYCDYDNDSLLDWFPYQGPIILSKTKAREKCEKFCARNRKCQICSLECNKTCQWNARTGCDDNSSQKSVVMEMSRKPGKEHLH